MTIGLRPALPSDDEFLFSVYASTGADEMDSVDWNISQKEHFCGCSSIHGVIALATRSLVEGREVSYI